MRLQAGIHAESAGVGLHAWPRCYQTTHKCASTISTVAGRSIPGDDWVSQRLLRTTTSVRDQIVDVKFDRGGAYLAVSHAAILHREEEERNILLPPSFCHAPLVSIPIMKIFHQGLVRVFVQAATRNGRIEIHDFDEYILQNDRLSRGGP